MSGIWGIWMPGFPQFLTGTYLFVGLTWFGSFNDKPLYMAALAFTAYGVHWFALGLGRALGGDPRPNALMAIPFGVISVLGAVVFFHVHDNPVGGLFIGLTCVYVSEFVASFFVRVPAAPEPVAGAVPPKPPKPEPTPLGALGERALGFFHLGTGVWLMYLMFAVTVNTALGFHWTV
jgi:hypothetical protein